MTYFKKTSFQVLWATLGMFLILLCVCSLLTMIFSGYKIVSLVLQGIEETYPLLDLLKYLVLYTISSITGWVSIILWKL